MTVNTVSIRASATAVFDVLADGWAYSNWVVGTSHMRAVEASWPQVGARLFHCAGAWPVVLRDVTEVEYCDPGRALTLLASGQPFGKARVALRLADEGARCTVTMTETPVQGAGKVLNNPLSELLLHRRNTESLARLQALVERRTAP